jgi:ABC-type glycerol-3-phosphate transport system permease component
MYVPDPDAALSGSNGTQFIIFQKIGWVNTFLPLIVPQFCGQAFFIFLMAQFIKGIPSELDQSAMMTISLIPVFAVFIIFQKYIVQGLVTSGLKGEHELLF